MKTVSTVFRGSESLMSQHTNTRCWLHYVWSTKSRYKILEPEIRKKLSLHFQHYAEVKGIFMKINYVNADHVHALIDLPDDKTMRDVAKLIKGESSHWLNDLRAIQGQFRWQRGYGAFSVSPSLLSKTCNYIANQAEHHRTMTFREEYQKFMKAYGLVWHDDGNVSDDDDEDEE